MIATFAIGPILVRHFSVEEMGTYKTFFLVYMTMYGLAQLGMAESLYYFVPRAAGCIGRYVCNAALTLLVAGLACLALLWGFRVPIADICEQPGAGRHHSAAGDVSHADARRHGAGDHDDLAQAAHERGDYLRALRLRPHGAVRRPGAPLRQPARGVHRRRRVRRDSAGDDAGGGLAAIRPRLSPRRCALAHPARLRAAVRHGRRRRSHPHQLPPVRRARPFQSADVRDLRHGLHGDSACRSDHDLDDERDDGEDGRGFERPSGGARSLPRHRLAADVPDDAAERRAGGARLAVHHHAVHDEVCRQCAHLHDLGAHHHPRRLRRRRDAARVCADAFSARHEPGAARRVLRR